MSDLISRADAIEAVRLETGKLGRGLLGRGDILDIISSLPSAEASSDLYKRGFEDAKRAFLVEYAKESENMLKRNAQLEVMLNAYKAILSDAENKHYIKIYADDEPSVKAEKLYQICGETQNREVAEWLKEYFPSVDRPQGEWIKRHEIINQITFFGENRCSNCGKISFIKSDFCPNCGAEMGKGGDTE